MRLGLGSDPPDQDVAGTDPGADADDARFVEVPEEALGDAGHLARDGLRTQLGVPRLHGVLLDVDRGVAVVLDEPLRNDDCVLEVVAAPRHEGDQHVAAERQFAAVGARAVGDDLTPRDAFAHLHERLLVDRGVLVGPPELLQPVDAGPDLGLSGPVALLADNDPAPVDPVHDSVLPAHDDRPGIASGHELHAGADERRLRRDQRDGLALHVRAHQGPVRVVVLEERNERGRHRDDLLGRHVDEVDVFSRCGHELALVTAVDARVEQFAALSHPGVRLRDRVAFFLERRKVERVRDENGGFPAASDLGVRRLGVLPRDDAAGLELGVPGILDAYVVHDPAVHDLPVRALDETVVVDRRVAGERTDQPDVRTFRRLDRTDAPVVRRVDIPHVELGAVTGESPRTQCRETSLVRHLGEWIRLFHELRELGGAEELTHGGRHRLRVDQVPRHRGRHFLIHVHLFANRPFHPDEAQAELVLEEFADRPDAAVAEVVDVVRPIAALAAGETQEVVQNQNEILFREDGPVGIHLALELGRQLAAPDPGEVVLLLIEEQVVEQGPGAFHRRLVAGTLPAIELDERPIDTLGVRCVRAPLPRERILVEGVGQNRAHRIRARQHDPDRADVAEFVHEFRGQPRVGRNLLTRVRNRHGDGEPEPAESLEMEIQRLPALPGQLPDVTPADPFPAFDDDFTVRLDVPLDALVEEHVLQRVGQRQPDTVPGQGRFVRVEEAREDRFGLPEPQRPQEDRRGEALLAVDTDLQEPPRVRFELEP